MAIASDLDVLDVGVIDALDVQMFLDCCTYRGHVVRVSAFELAFDLLERPGDLHVVEVHRRQADTRIRANGDRDQQYDPADEGNTSLLRTHRHLPRCLSRTT